MGRSKRKQVLTNNTDHSNLTSQYKIKAKRNAVGLFEKSLLLRGVRSEERSSIIEDIYAAVYDHDEKMEPQLNNVSLKTNVKFNADEHNEACDVCETGGDLLCCDTCSLVFHLKCIRPRLTSVPKGDWSCSQCILDGLCPGDTDLAKKALRSMNLVACGFNSDDEADAKKPNKAKPSKQLTVVQSGKKLAVRQIDSKQQQYVDLGRFLTLDEALCCLCSFSSKHTNKKHSGSSDDEDDDELWCVHCLDDDRVSLCAFCGCKKCYGKYDSDLLILCDFCEREIHTYCFDPPLSQVPQEDPWYCSKECSTTHQQHQQSAAAVDGRRLSTEYEKNSRLVSVNSKYNNAELSSTSNSGDDNNDMSESDDGSYRGVRPKSMKRQSSISSLASFKSGRSVNSAQSITAATPGATVSRGRGRPPGSSKKQLYVKDSESQSYSETTHSLVEKTTSTSSIAGKNPLNGNLSRGNNVVVGSPKNNSQQQQVSDGISTNLESIRRLVAKIGRRSFRSREEDTLSQFRQWAPIFDLELVLEDLHAQKNSFLERITQLQSDANMLENNFFVTDSNGSLPQQLLNPSQQTSKYESTELSGYHMPPMLMPNTLSNSTIQPPWYDTKLSSVTAGIGASNPAYIHSFSPRPLPLSLAELHDNSMTRDLPVHFCSDIADETGVKYSNSLHSTAMTGSAGDGAATCTSAPSSNTIANAHMDGIGGFNNPYNILDTQHSLTLKKPRKLKDQQISGTNGSSKKKSKHSGRGFSSLEFPPSTIVLEGGATQGMRHHHQMLSYVHQQQPLLPSLSSLSNSMLASADGSSLGYMPASATLEEKIRLSMMHSATAMQQQQQQQQQQQLCSSAVITSRGNSATQCSSSVVPTSIVQTSTLSDQVPVINNNGGQKATDVARSDATSPSSSSSLPAVPVDGLWKPLW